MCVNSIAVFIDSGVLLEVCVHAKALQLCLTLCNPMDYSLPGSSVYRIIQGRILAWIAMPSSPDDLPDPGMEAPSFTSPALAGGFFTTLGSKW